MLGRLQMTVDDCIHAYTTLSARVFQKKRHRLTFKGNVQGRFDSDELEQAIKDIVQDQKLPRDALLKDSPTAKCKVFVCATSCETGDTVRLRSYRSPRGRDRDVKIWEAGRATSAASSFFDPITVDAFGEYFVDGATGVNNPVYEVWSEAQDIWPSLSFEDNVRCLVSIGTGVPSLTPFKGSLMGIFEVLKKIATETQKTAELFSRDKAKLGEEGRYHRFDVVRGLEDVGLENVMKMPEIVAASDRYVESQAVFKQMNVCAEKMKACAVKMVENDG
jgi:predicted acylesterase/phospholipase RssA